MLRFETLAHPDTSVIHAMLSSPNATKTSLFFPQWLHHRFWMQTLWRKVNLRHILMVRVGKS